MSDLRRRMDALYDRKVTARVEAAVRFLGLSIYTGLKLETPVDTGRARANWHMDLNSVDVRIVEPNENVPPEQAALAIARFRMNDIIYISNNLPYINRLNDGYSQQAPAGFVEGTIEVAKAATKRRFK